MQHFRKMQNYYLQCALQSKNMRGIIGLVIHIYNYNGLELILRESSLSLILQNENIFRNLSSTLLYQKLFQWVQSIKNGYICMSLSVKFLPRVFISNYFIKAFDRQRRIVGVKKTATTTKQTRVFTLSCQIFFQLVIFHLANPAFSRNRKCRVTSFLPVSRVQSSRDLAWVWFWESWMGSLGRRNYRKRWAVRAGWDPGSPRRTKHTSCRRKWFGCWRVLDELEVRDNTEQSDHRVNHKAATSP